MQQISKFLWYVLHYFKNNSKYWRLHDHLNTDLIVPEHIDNRKDCGHHFYYSIHFFNYNYFEIAEWILLFLQLYIKF